MTALEYRRIVSTMFSIPIEESLNPLDSRPAFYFFSFFLYGGRVNQSLFLSLSKLALFSSSLLPQLPRDFLTCRVLLEITFVCV